MSEFLDFMDGFWEGTIEGINSCTIGKIEKFDATTMKADVVPLVKKKNKDGTTEDISLLIEVPVSFMKAGPFLIRPPYKTGDIVLVVFADRDIENVLFSGDKGDPIRNDLHSLDNAIIVGGIMPFTKALPADHVNDLIIAKDDFSTKIVIKENGDIIIKGGKIYLGADTAVEGVPLGNALKTWLDSHTHPSPEGETGPPSSSSPAPSGVVKTI